MDDFTIHNVLEKVKIGAELRKVYALIMCGIAGFIGRGGEQDLRKMILALKHRGPDHQGVFFANGVGLASARLAIIDLSPEGNQPMFDASGRIGIVFNGEIYDFQALRAELEEKVGYTFRSHTDTEVILAAYGTYGEQCFERLNGMFAIALYDFHHRRLILARDRMGKKPLYYGVFDGTLVFGSELKALLEHPAVKKEIDLSGLNAYLQHEYIPTPRTIFKNIHKLEPATAAVWENGMIRKFSYWEADFTVQDLLPFADARTLLDRVLEESVRTRLVADVPVGVFLSGGIDSSTIAYYASRFHPKIKSFSIGFRERSFNELPYAEEVAHALGTDHFVRMVTSSDMLDLIPRIQNVLDEPLADVSIVPMYLLSQFAREHVTVALSGDGADELLGGYATFQAEKFADAYERIPRMIRLRLIEPIIRALPVRDGYFSLDFRFKKFLDGFSGKSAHRHHLWMGSFNSAERQQLFDQKVARMVDEGNEFEEIDRYRMSVRADDPMNVLLYLYQRTYMMDGVLAKVDRASMANSLEVRSPFLDARVVELINRLPSRYKIRGFTTKYVLKSLMTSRLPRSVVRRTKKGFGIPLDYWLRHELKDFSREKLSPLALGRHGFFNQKYVTKLLDEHAMQRVNHARKLWVLMVFQLWYERWFV